MLKYDEDGVLVSANLDLRNPNRREPWERLSPRQLAADLSAKEQRIVDLLRELADLLPE